MKLNGGGIFLFYRRVEIDPVITPRRTKRAVTQSKIIRVNKVDESAGGNTPEYTVILFYIKLIPTYLGNFQSHIAGKTPHVA